MIPTVILQAMIAMLTLLNVGCAIYVARRTQKWRESDEAKEFDGRVSALEQKMGGINDKALGERLTAVEGQVIAINSRMEAMATKSDVEALKTAVTNIYREVEKIDGGVTRIESWLMERGK